MISSCIFAIAVALLASLVLTPPVRVGAIRLGFVDMPDKARKLHRHSTPLCGGLAVLGGVLVSLICLTLASDSFHAAARSDLQFFLTLAAAAGIVCITGLLDDRFELRGRQKLAGQFLASLLLAMIAVRINTIEVFGWRLELGPLAIPFTVFFLLGAINALNLIDGIDGLATTVGIVLSAALGTMALLTDHYVEAVLAAALLGAQIGFLVYNFPPASIFLGDAGSMLIGLLLGVLAIRGSLKGPATIAMAAPLAVWAIPILDVGMALLRRKLTGRSIYDTDRGHLHHSLMHRGMSELMTVVFIGALCGTTALAAICSVYLTNEYLALGAIAAVTVVLMVTRLFGHKEFVLLLQRSKHFLLSLVPSLRNKRPAARQLQTRLQGTRQWEELWETLIAYAERFEICAVELNVHLPAMGEDYHATWNRQGRRSEVPLWYTEIPLMLHDTFVGRLRLSGLSHGQDNCVWMGDLIGGLKPFEADMVALINETMLAREVVVQVLPERAVHPADEEHEIVGNTSR